MNYVTAVLFGFTLGLLFAGMILNGRLVDCRSLNQGDCTIDFSRGGVEVRPVQ